VTREGPRAGAPPPAAGESVTAGFYQFAPERSRPDRNLDRIETALRSARVDLLVCPELCLTGYLFLDRAELMAVAEPVPGGPSSDRLRDLARETGTAVVAGLAEREDARVYNSAALFAPDGAVTVYRKAHLFGTENRVFDRAGRTPRIASVAGLRVGIMICYDWMFPEMARILALEGADLIAHPANLVLPYCQDAMVTRSIENGVYTVTASRTGQETVDGVTLRFTGKSQIVSPRGERLATADPSEECVGHAAIRPALARAKRINEHNDLLADRRTDLYEPLVRPRGGPA
jgi:predicted amidohydrolase